MSYFLLAGRDHLDWLQGQVTNDVRLLNERPWLDFCITNPKGQLQSVCRAWGTGDTVTLATDRPEVLEARIEETVILEDVTLVRVTGRFACVQGPLAEPSSRSLASDRTGSGGFEVPESEAGSHEVLSREAYDLATLEAGIPLVGADTGDKSLPPELGTGFDANFVSYTKGCYTGQEVLMRIKARGHTNKTWVGLRAESAIGLGSQVTHEGKEVGTVHRAAFSPAFGHIASATLRNEATQEGTVVQVGDKDATVVTMPFLR